MKTGSAKAQYNELYQDISEFEHVRRWPIGQIAGGAAIIATLLWIVLAFVRGQIEWSIVGQYLSWPAIIAGLGNTLLMTALAMTLGICIGVTIAIMRLSPNPVFRAVAVFYTWFFRGVPVLLQLLIWFNLALVFPRMEIPGLFEFRTVDVMTPFVAAFLGLGINQGAYTSEVVRAGLLSVDVGQAEAASAIGMARLQALRRIVLPQAMRVIVPPIGNEIINMIKLTSLASVIQYAEMVYQAENIYYANNYVIELLIVASFWYLVVVSVLSIFQQYLESYLARGSGFVTKSR